MAGGRLRLVSPSGFRCSAAFINYLTAVVVNLPSVPSGFGLRVPRQAGCRLLKIVLLRNFAHKC
jgi:hypothetical protein